MVRATLVCLVVLMAGMTYAVLVQDVPKHKSKAVEKENEVDVTKYDEDGNKVDETFIFKNKTYVIVKPEKKNVCVLVEHNYDLDGNPDLRCADGTPLDRELVSQEIAEACGDRDIVLYKEHACGAKSELERRRRKRGICIRYICYYYWCTTARTSVCYTCFYYYYYC